MNTTMLKDVIARFRKELAPFYPKGEIEGMKLAVLDHLLHYSQVDLILHADDEVPDFIIEKINGIVERLKHYEPIQYILGDAYFYGHHFKVTRDTLIPRPETEGLIDMIADENNACDLRVLDIGTGSGCIAISLSLALRFPDVYATDISQAALAVARENAARLKGKVKFVQSDILAADPCINGKFDIIVSNPPYICNEERDGMDKNVLEYEPHSALFVPDDDPMLFYKAISRYAIHALVPGGRLYLEINSRFPKETCSLLQNVEFDNILAVNDYCGRPRFVKASKPTD